MRTCGVALSLICILTMADLSFGADRPTIKICTWNIEHLAARDNTGCKPRTARDYKALKRYVAGLAADIIAFQEVEDMAAARRVFDPSVYDIEISSRPDVQLGRCREDGRQRRMQRTGFAIRKNMAAKFGVVYTRRPDVRMLATRPSERWGVHIELNPAHGEGKPLHLLCVHLKSGCAYDDPVYRGDDSPCSRLAEQAARLETWMDEQADSGQEFIVLGDMNRQLDQLGDPVWEAWDDSESCEWEKPSTGLWLCREGSSQFNPIADVERARSGRKHPFPRNPRYPFAVDHIIMSAGADRTAIERSARFIRDTQNLSDHTPLVMEFYWLQNE